MHSVGLYIKNIGDRPKSSQWLPGLQIAFGLYIIRDSCEGTSTSPYNHIMYSIQNNICKKKKRKRKERKKRASTKVVYVAVILSAYELNIFKYFMT